jgi:nicotinamide mononucleotide transporter
MLESLLGVLQIGSALELIAMLLAIAYLVLAIREQRACWYAALVSTALYTYIFWDVSLLMESALNVFYMAMAVYGWWRWQSDDQSLPIQRWSWQKHVKVAVIVLVLSVVSGTFLSNNTSAALPFLDSFTTWASVFATFMVANKVLENWWYWIVIDTASVYLYFDRELYITVVLFLLYIALAIIGLRQWMSQQNNLYKSL